MIMEIEDIRLSRFRNEQHFQFQTEFNNLIIQFTPAALGIEAKYAVYLPLFNSENMALDLIRKSAVTIDLFDADILRGNTFRGTSDAIQSAMNHFNNEVKKAAARIMVVFDSYGNVTLKTYNEETAATNKLIKELTENHAEDVATLGIGDWLAALQTNNDAFDALMKSRYTEDAGKTLLRMKQVRVEVDVAYRSIVKRINALIEINGDDAYLGFVKEMKQRIDKYSAQLPRHKGKNGGDNEPQEPEK